MLCVFFFKQKTAYEMRISDWSSDVCSSDLNRDLGLAEMAALDPLKRGAADISFVAPHVDSLAGLGAYSTGDHGPEETVDIPSIGRQATRAAILMSRYAAEKR